MEAVSFPLAFLAGLLSIFSPCVLPLLPVVLGTAVSQHKLGPVALVAGLSLSFLGLGMVVATVGFSLGLNPDFFRFAAALMLVLMGFFLLVSQLQMKFSQFASPFGNWAETQFGNSKRSGLGGQFSIGLLLGAVWTPCVGPTLGAASVLAAQGRNLSQVAFVMLIFTIGTAIPLLLIGLLSRETFMRLRGRMLTAGQGGTRALGLVLVATAALILTGYDKAIETALLDLTPAWMTEWITGI
jgi:cytochrome c biogenesis protein CcdA